MYSNYKYNDYRYRLIATCSGSLGTIMKMHLPSHSLARWCVHARILKVLPVQCV